MNDKTQASTRKAGFGTEGIGEDGDEGLGETAAGAGGTGTTQTGGRRNGDVPAEGASGDASAKGRGTLENKQGMNEGELSDG